MSRGAPPERVALIFPPVWYYTAVPADLSETAGALRAAGLGVSIWDLNAALHRDLLGDSPGFEALRQPDTYRSRAVHAAASEQLRLVTERVSERFGVRYTLRLLSFPGLDLADLPAARAVGLDEARNPALPTLRAAAAQICASGAEIAAIALVHPDQVPHALALLRLMRAEGFTGRLLLYGSLEDVLSPADFAADLPGAPTHALFEDADAVIAGEGEAALLSLATAWPARPEQVPGVVTAAGAGPSPVPLDLRSQALPVFDGVNTNSYMSPSPVVDLRLGRGCPWGRCAFCAIQAHQPGYRAGPVQRVVGAMARAHEVLGSVFFRIRDDLLTPLQLVELSEAVAALPFRPRWSARARLDRGLTEDALAAAAAGGLEELWLGLESGSERVRALMDKGVRDADVRRILGAGQRVGLRLRALCLVGYPGERLDEAVSTLRFVAEHVPQLAGFALSPFQLMRTSPMAGAPEKHGLRLLPDPHPRERRLRWSLPFEAANTLSPAVCETFVQRAYATVVPRFPPVLGPDIHHDWISASVHRAGWPT